MRETEFHVLFIDGLTPVLKSIVTPERHQLLVFQRDNRSSLPETIAPLDLHARGIFNRLSAIVAPLAAESGSKKANVSAIIPDLDHSLNDISPEPERIVSWCSQMGDPNLTDAVVAAFQNSNFRRQQRPPLGDKRPTGLCHHLHCSK